MQADEMRWHRQWQRQIEGHLRQWHMLLGAQVAPVGVVDVVTHPTQAMRELNYITPRPGMAMIPPQQITEGLAQLRTRRGAATLQFIEPLYPAHFQDMLTDLGLQRQRSTLILAKGTTSITTAPGWQVMPVSTRKQARQWWALWYLLHPQTALQDALTKAEYALNEAAQGNHLYDLLMDRNGRAIGLARYSLFDASAQLVALRLLNTYSTLANQQLALSLIEQRLARAGCDLLFVLLAPPSTQQADYLTAGFVDLGHIVYYVEGMTTPYEDQHGTLAQPLLGLR